MLYNLSKEEVDLYRPKPFYFITSDKKEDLTYDEAKKSLDRMKEEGFGGIVLFNKPPYGFNDKNYLFGEWFEMVENFARAAEDCGMALWINDGFNFPPGDVAGRVHKVAPHLKQKRIQNIDGKLVVCEVEWGFPAFEEPKSSELFTTFVHEEYKKHVGKYFGRSIKGFFSDADNRRVNYTVMNGEDSPMYDYFPWSDRFEETFYNEYGYKIMPYMFDIIERKNIKQARDYWEHAGRLMQSWFKSNHEWCNKNGLEYTGHTSDSSPFLYKDAPRSSCFSEGKFSDLERNFDYPGTDQELLALDGGRHLRTKCMYVPSVVWGCAQTTEKMPNYFDISHDTRAKQAGSTAFTYGKKGAMCEMFAASNFGTSPHELRQIAAFQMMQGITFVVPHAYHHRFTGVTKYFAPPEFSSNGHLAFSINELNNMIAETTCMLNKGKLIAPVALLDVTEAVWQNCCDTEKFFDAFVKLNRLPYGYVIADVERILANKDKFKVVVNPGVNLSYEERSALDEAKIAVISIDEMAVLNEIVSCNVLYRGEGTPHFMRREIDGEEFVFIANIEDEHAINGILSIGDKDYDIILQSGEIKYISSKYNNLTKKYNLTGDVVSFPDVAKVTFEDENILPLERFENNGKVCVKSSEDDILNFDFGSSDELFGLKLYIPISCDNIIEKVLLDGTDLTFKNIKVFDDDYKKYALPELKKGQHRIEIVKNAPLESLDRIFVKGNFDIAVESDESEFLPAFTTYNLKVFVPEKAKITLSRRRDTMMMTKSWAMQGQPFYSGKVKYEFYVNIPQEFSESLMIMPKVCDACELKINGILIDKRVWQPYMFPFCSFGNCKIEITVQNSYANAFECYAADSGILNSGFVVRIKM